MIGARLGADRGPSPALPFGYFAAAAAAFAVAAASVPWLAPELGGHYYHPRLLALTHTVALGWITLTIIGASYQLVPIVLERPLWSERLARWQLAVLVAGIIGMVGHFWIARWAGLVWAAGLVALGLAAHLVNVTLSVRGLARWSFTARLVVVAHAGLGLTLLFGLGLASARLGGGWPGNLLAAIHAHFHLAVLGWMAPMVIGVAARVFPMFLLAPEPGGVLGWLQLGGLGLGVPAIVAGLLAVPGLIQAGAVAVAAALAAHLAWVTGMLRQRRRPALDWGLRFAFTGTAFLVPAALLGLALAFGLLSGPRAVLPYAILGLGGWVSLTVVGMLLKIVPFLTWQRAYAPHVGRRAVPTLAELSWPAAEGVAYALLTGGVVVLAAAVGAGATAWIRAAGGVLTLGALAFGGTFVHLWSHRAPAAPPRAATTAAGRELP